MATRPACCVGWLVSATRASIMGRAPPNPNPVSPRATTSDDISHANDVSKEKIPNNATEATSTFLRPTLSARRPPISAPKNNPSVLALKNVPNWSGVGLNSAPIPAAATPAACKSIPSQSAVRKQKRIVTVLPEICAAVMFKKRSVWFFPQGHQERGYFCASLHECDGMRLSRLCHEALRFKHEAQRPFNGAQTLDRVKTARLA